VEAGYLIRVLDFKIFMKIYLRILICLVLVGCSIDEDQGIKNALENNQVGGSEAEAFADRVAPTGKLSIDNKTDYTRSSTSVSISLSATDNKGVRAYCLSESSSTPGSSSSCWTSITTTTSFTDNQTFSFSGNQGNRNLNVWYRDQSKVSEVASDTLTCPETGNCYSSKDSTSPSGSISYSSGCNTNNITMNATDNIGVTKYYLSKSGTTPGADDSDWTSVTETTSFSKSISASSYAYSYVYVWYKDGAGNLSSRYSTYVSSSSSSDYTAPTGSISINEPSSASSTVEVNLAATDSCGVTGYYLSESTSTPSSSSSDWTALTSTTSYSDNVSYTFSSFSASETLYVWFKDAAGNVSSRYSDTYSVPVVINSGSDYTNSLSVSISMTHTDSSGITGYYISESSTAPPISASGWVIVSTSSSFSQTVSHTFSSGSGTKTIYVWYRNSNGTVSNSYSDSIVYETTAPSGSISINSGASSSSIRVTLNLSATDSYGVTGYYVSESSSTPSYNASDWVSVTSSTSYSDNISFTLSVGNGNKTVYAWFKDGANNVSSRYSDNITLSFEGQLSAGVSHTCLLNNAGTIHCSGLNSNYQLGNGSTSNSSSPVSVNNLSNSVGISLGAKHSCAVTQEGNVKCWGSGSYGQQGDSSTSNNSSPGTVCSNSYCSSSYYLQNIILVASGNNHNCAIKSGGTVYCWGYNGYKQLGDGTSSDKSFAVQVSNLSDITELALGSLHSCALLSSGSVKCWGYGGTGQIGNGSDSNVSNPSSVSGISSATKITAGSSHTCALISGGTVKCWGYGGNGQLGNGTTSSSNVPVSVSALTSVSGISAGDTHTCALLSSGAVKCWGGNTYGQLGNSSSTSSSSPVSVSSLSTASQIALGENHSCAFLSDNTSKCWGRNNYGQFGSGDTNDSNSPTSSSFTTNDTSAPTNGSITISRSRYNASAYVSISATDDFGVTAYCVQTSSSTPSSSASCWTSVTLATSFSKSSISVSLSSQYYSTRSAYVWFRDAVGNVSSRYSDSIYCDYYCN